MNYNIIKAAAIAGGGIGLSAGFLTRSEKLENSGASTPKQVAGGLAHGVGTGLAGAGIGVGISGTAAALKGILGK